jgi:hypothetical protein
MAASKVDTTERTKVVKTAVCWVEQTVASRAWTTAAWTASNLVETRVVSRAVKTADSTDAN